jgi:hypothetical protein
LLSDLVSLIPSKPSYCSWVETHIKLSSLELHARFATCLELFDKPQLSCIQDELLPFYELKISEDPPVTSFQSIRRWDSLCRIVDVKSSSKENLIVDQEEILDFQIEQLKDSIISLVPEKRAFYIDKLCNLMETFQNK